jgi:hypothetical protein
MSKLLDQKSNLAPPNSEASTNSQQSSLNPNSYLSYSPPNLPYVDRMSPFLDSINYKKGLKKLGNIDSYVSYHQYNYTNSTNQPPEITGGILSELGEFILTEDNNNLIIE